MAPRESTARAQPRTAARQRPVRVLAIRRVGWSPVGPRSDRCGQGGSGPNAGGFFATESPEAPRTGSPPDSTPLLCGTRSTRSASLPTQILPRESAARARRHDAAGRLLVQVFALRPWPLRAASRTAHRSAAGHATAADPRCDLRDQRHPERPAGGRRGAGARVGPTP